MYNQIAVAKLLLVFIIGFSFSISAQPLRRLQPKGAYGKPNIILLEADNFTYADLDLVLKNKSEFQNFNNVFSNALFLPRLYLIDSDTKQNKSALITGIHPIKEPVKESGVVAPQIQIVSQLLKNAGYRTGVLGKWCFNENPTQRGFDQWFGYLTGQQSPENDPQVLWRNENKLELPNLRAEQKIDLLQEMFIRTTTNFLRIYREYPFFLYLPSNLPSKATNQMAGLTGKTNVLSRTEVDSRKKMLKRLDDYLGKIFECLEYYKLSDKTLFLFTSIVDVDSMQIKEGEVGKSLKTIQKELNIPTFILWQDKIKSSTNNILLSINDITPTILELADAAIPKEIDGRAFASILFSSNKVSSIRKVVIVNSNSQEAKYLLFSDSAAGFLSVKSSDWVLFPTGSEGYSNSELSELKKSAIFLLNQLTNSQTAVFK